MNKNEKIRVLFLITDLGKGGAQRYLIDLCRELEKNNEFEFIIGSLSELNLYEELTEGLPIINLNYSQFTFFRNNKYPEFKKLIESFKPQIIHTHRFLAEFLSSFYVNKDTVYICHGHDKMEQFRKLNLREIFRYKSLINFLEKELVFQKKYRKVRTIFLANSKDTQVFFQQVLPKRLRTDVLLFPLGFNYALFFNSTPKMLSPGQKIKIINVGSFQPKKNQLFIIEIAKELKKRMIDFEINLFGDGELFNEVQNAIRLNCLENQVFLHGNVNNVEDWYKKSHLYLHTAWYEPFGLVFLEAMAAGLPIVTLDGKGNRELFINKKNGFIFSNQDPRLFANAIEKLMNEPTLFRKISEHGKEYARLYDTSLTNKNLIKLYRSFF